MDKIDKKSLTAYCGKEVKLLAMQASNSAVLDSTPCHSTHRQDGCSRGCHRFEVAIFWVGSSQSTSRYKDSIFSKQGNNFFLACNYNCALELSCLFISIKAWPVFSSSAYHVASRCGNSNGALSTQEVSLLINARRPSKASFGMRVLFTSYSRDNNWSRTPNDPQLKSKWDVVLVLDMMAVNNTFKIGIVLRRIFLITRSSSIQIQRGTITGGGERDKK